MISLRLCLESKKVTNKFSSEIWTVISQRQDEILGLYIFSQIYRDGTTNNSERRTIEWSQSDWQQVMNVIVIIYNKSQVSND